MKKRIFALALALCMMLSSMPTSFAGNGFLTLDNGEREPSEPSGILTPGDPVLPEEDLSGEPHLTLDDPAEGSQPAPDDPIDEPHLTLDDPVDEPEDRPAHQWRPAPFEEETFTQCDICGYLDGSHAVDCPVVNPPEEQAPAQSTIAEYKPAPMSAATYQDIYDSMMSAETLAEYKAELSALSADLQEEFFSLLTGEEREALSEREDSLAHDALTVTGAENATRTVTVEARASAFSFALHEALRQLGQDLIVSIYGRILESIDLPQNDYTMLETITPTDGARYQWQIQADDDLWVDIYNETGSIIRVSYAMVASLLDRYDAVQVRCEITGEDGVSYTDPVKVCVDYTSDDVYIDAEEDPIEPVILDEGKVEITQGQPVEPEAPAGPEEITEPEDTAEPATPAEPEDTAAPDNTAEPEDTAAPAAPAEPEDTAEPENTADPVAQSFSVTRLGGVYAQNFSVRQLTGEGEQTTTYNVVVKYVFENNEIVADPYTANLAAGSNFSATVTFPVIQGYLPYVGNDEETSASIDLKITNIQNDVIYTVTYKPTNVNYTVIHYQQNLNDDNYTEAERETKQGLTNSTVPDVANTYEGFYALLYEKPAIAADGSTVVEVYYDRYYYLMNFDLDGGYGVEPIYARYGTPIGDVGTPTKAGYTFTGWSLNGVQQAIPPKMPAENRTYKAIWDDDDTAKVTIVFWGENADDEAYSYIKSSEVYVKTGTEFTYSESGTLICALEEHPHSVAGKCYTLTCEQEEHTHSESCYSCGESSHTHGTTCYAGVGSASSAGTGTPSNPSNGYVSREAWSLDGKVIYINGTWYEYTGNTRIGRIATPTCGKTESTHTHTDTCLGCGKTEHTHSIENGCYELTCTKTEHSHTSDCYMSGAGLDSNLWKFVKSDTVTVAADGSTVVNVYYDRTTFTLTFRDNNNTVATITEKWGAYISDKFNEEPFNTTYNGRAWECTEKSKYSYALQTLDRMPKFDATFKLYDQNSTTLKTIYYYVENVGANVSENTWPTDTNNFKLLKTVQTYFNFATYNEEYHEIEGYNRYSARVAGFNNNQKNFSNNTLYLYYLRKDYTLTYNDGYDDVTKLTVPYQDSLSQYSFTPEVPSAYEPGSVVFGGWYLNPECSEGKEAPEQMPLGNLILYAKWVPKGLKVEFYLDEAALNAGTKLSTHPDITVPHGSLVTPAPEDPENGSYTFVGWFYMENGVEKAFDFANMPVKKNMQVYGKWSSNSLMPYTVYYKIQGTDTEIAAPTTGSGLAGVTKTFEAKGGSDLYAAYQVGYFPVTKSHSMTLDINATGENDTNVYTFWYVQKAAVPYTVKYLDKETGEPVADEKTVSDNRKAVVTETFVPVSGMMPDAYQKRLVVSAEEGAVNEIIFYYTEDTTHAYYKITHYTENLATDAQGNPTWTDYASSQAVGDIRTIYTAEPMTIPGFTYDSTVAGTVASGELTANGLELKLYYTRNSYPYQVRYLEQGTGQPLAGPKNDTGKYGEVISESAIDITNYDAVAPTSQTLNIKIETEADDQGNLIAAINIITFYYKEQEATISYQVVGPVGSGKVTPTSETLKVLNGTAQGSTATVTNNTYRFVGWYTDAACTTPVDAGWVDANNKLTPVKAKEAVWATTTYYAKFEYNVADLTITKRGAQEIDKDQTFIFTLQGASNDDNTKDVALTVVVTGNESVTIKDLPVGQYTISENTNWSWRYMPEGNQNDQTVIVNGGKANSITFANKRRESKWLDGNAICENIYVPATTAQPASIKRKDEE